MEDDRDYWFKATGQPNAHEPAVTCLLSELAEPYLPRIIATKPAWNAWLMSGEAKQVREVPADSLQLFPLLTDAVESMAALQLRTMGHSSDLLAAGAFDQSPTAFEQHSVALFALLEQTLSL